MPEPRLLPESRCESHNESERHQHLGQTFRDGKGRYRSELVDVMNFKTFSANRSLQASLWSLASEILQARERPRPMLHTLLNLLAQRSCLTAIITTNIDGLEIMNDSLLPEEAKGYAWADGGWLHQHPDLLLALHGSITEAFCSSCKVERFSLNRESVAQLIEGSHPPCQQCSTRPRFSANRGAFWRPDITFYEDSHEGLRAESDDEDYEGGAGTIPLGRPDRYRMMMSDASKINSLFIIGSSLSSKQLCRDLSALIKEGVKAFIINPHPPSQLARLANRTSITSIKVESEVFAKFVYSNLTM